jgi:hypothetical protein
VRLIEIRTFSSDDTLRLGRFGSLDDEASIEIFSRQGEDLPYQRGLRMHLLS